jgi:hypothetical protein
MADSKDDSKLFWSARQSRHLSAGDLAGQARPAAHAGAGNADAFVDAMPARRLIARLNGGPLIAVLQWNSSRRASTKTA